MLLQESASDSDSDVSTADGVTVQIRNNDGTVTTAAQHELQIAADLAAQPAWFGGGRFGGREGKLARIRQQEALAAAKLGLSSSSPEVTPATQHPKASKKRKTAPSTAEEQLIDPIAAATVITVKTQKGSKKRKAQKAVTELQADAVDATPATSADPAAAAIAPTWKRVVIEPAVTALAPAVPFVPTPTTGWWGAKKFKSAGCLEGLDQQRSQAQSERQEFDEDDQTNLYMAAQNLKTSGKKGLGTKTHIGQSLSPCIFAILWILMSMHSDAWSIRSGDQVPHRSAVGPLHLLYSIFLMSMPNEALLIKPGDQVLHRSGFEPLYLVCAALCCINTH